MGILRMLRLVVLDDPVLLSYDLQQGCGLGVLGRSDVQQPFCWGINVVTVVMVIVNN